MATAKKKKTGTKPGNKNTKTGPKMKGKKTANKEVTAIILFAVGVLLFLCFIGKVGIVGDVVCSVAFGLLGQTSSYLLLAFLFYTAWNLIRGNPATPGFKKNFFFLFLVLMISAFVHTAVFTYTAESDYVENIGSLLASYREGASGGLFGGSLSFVLQKYMTKVGAYVVLIPLIIVLAMLLFSFSVANIVKRISSMGNKAGAGIRKIKDRFDEDVTDATEVHYQGKKQASEGEMEQIPLDMDGLINTKGASLHIPEKKEKPKMSAFSKFYDKLRPEETEEIAEKPVEFDAPEVSENEDYISPEIYDFGVTGNIDVEGSVEEAFSEMHGFDLPPKKEKQITALEGLAAFEEETELPDTAAPQSEPKPYVKPPVTLLNRSPKKGTSPMALKALATQTAKKLEDVLTSFGISAKVINISRGPSVTRYELQPSSGVKVSKIKNLSDDLALNLAATSIRIEAPIPGKAAIGIEIPNQEVDTVYLRDMIESEAFKKSKSKVTFCLGQDISGEAVVADLAKMPHLLVAGTTGAGKSICINCMILSILYNATPEEVKLILIDPKQVEFVPYEGIPHLFVPVVKDSRKAAGALAWAVAQMTERYKLFSENGVRDIKGYNEHAEANGCEKLPQIVIIIDELADLMMVARDAVEDSVCRLAQMARAAGMHLVIATQRPSVDVITGIIKANIPSRIALKVASQVDSRTIIDSAGAEKLLGRGDMMFMPIGSVKGTRIQGAFVSDSEVEAVVKFLKSNFETSYDEALINDFNAALEKEPERSGRGGGNNAGPDEDELLPKAIDIAVELKQISASYLQRKLGVGYNRAARLIDQMEERGIIGGKDGSNPRQVLVDKYNLEN